MKKIIKKYKELFKSSPLLTSFLLAVLIIAILQPISVGFVLGTSMEPNYSEGDIVVATGLEDPEIGEVVFFERPRDRGDIVHRVVGQPDENVYVTKGDNNDFKDGKVKEKYISGVKLIHLETSEFNNKYIPLLIIIAISGLLYLSVSFILFIPVKVLYILYDEFYK